MQYIKTTVSEFYENDYPEIFESDSAMVNKAIKGIQDKYKVNIFSTCQSYAY